MNRSGFALAACAATLALLLSPLMSSKVAAQDSPVNLRSANFPDRLVRHRNFQAELTQISPQEQADADFRVVGGLSGSGISFESVNFPGHYLRHQNFGLVLQRFDGSDLFRQDSSFNELHALDGGYGRSFEATNFPGHYLRHQNFVMRLAANDGTPLFAADASFEVVQRAAAACYWLQPGAPAIWQHMPQFPTRQACHAQDSCSGGLGQSGGGCYKWADGPDAKHHPW